MDNENILIEGKASGILSIIYGIVILVAIIFICNFQGTINKQKQLIENYSGMYDDFEMGYNSGNSSDHDYMISTEGKLQKATSVKGMATMGTVIAIIVVVVAIVLLLYTAGSKLTITNKRAYGVAAFRKRVDIPIDSVSAIGTGFLKSVVISSSSGKIVFAGLANQNNVYKTLSNLIVKRQENNQSHVTDSVVKGNISTADEIAKYKKLAEDNVISQEEFELKKKQLLGL